MEGMLDFIANNGFAIVVAVYMLVVNNKTVRENTEATNKLVSLLEHMMNNGGGVTK